MNRKMLGTTAGAAVAGLAYYELSTLLARVAARSLEAGAGTVSIPRQRTAADASPEVSFGRPTRDLRPC
jgi:hypothetical protein